MFFYNKFSLLVGRQKANVQKRRVWCGGAFALLLVGWLFLGMKPNGSLCIVNENQNLHRRKEFYSFLFFEKLLQIAYHNTTKLESPHNIHKLLNYFDLLIVFLKSFFTFAAPKRGMFIEITEKE